MILTYPKNQLFSEDDCLSVPGIRALEYNEVGPVFENNLERVFHSGMGIIQEGFIDYFNSIVDFLNSNKFKLFSFDLGPAASKVKIEDYYYVAESKVLSKSEIKEMIRSKLAYVKDKYSGQIALENLNYFPTSAYEHVCETDFINDVIIENNVYLVLDIAHAIIASQNMEIDTYDYILSLPSDLIKEIHLSAPGILEGKWRDLHEVPSEGEYELLGLVMKNISNEPYLVVEYSKDSAELKSIYNNLNHNYA